MKNITYFETRTTTIMSNSNTMDPFTCELADASKFKYLNKEKDVTRFLFDHQGNPDADSEFYSFSSGFYGDCSDFQKVGEKKWEMTDTVKITITLSDENYAKLLDELEVDDVYDFEPTRFDSHGVMRRVSEIYDFLYELGQDNYTEDGEYIDSNLIAKLGNIYDEYIDYLAGDDEE